MPPLVGGETDWVTVLVADVAAFHPSTQPVAVGAVADRFVAVWVRGGSGEQDRRLWPAVQDTALLLADELFELLIDGDEGFSFHLVVEVPQVGRAVAVVGDAVMPQTPRIAETQSAAHQDDGDQAPGRVVPQMEGAGAFKLGHDVLSQRSGQSLASLGVVLGVEHRVCWEAFVPAVLADRGEEVAQQSDVVAVDPPAGQLGVQLGQVAFQYSAVDVSDVVDTHRWGGKEGREPRDGTRAAGRLGTADSSTEPPAHPTLGQLFQPRLADAVKAHVSRGALVDTQVAQPPKVSRVLDLPTAAIGQVFDLAKAEEDQRPLGGP